MRLRTRRVLMVAAATAVAGGAAAALVLGGGGTRPSRSPGAARHTTGPSTQATGAPSTSVPSRPPSTGTAPHVMIIVMENHGYASIVGSPTAPYLNGLIRRGGLATASYATTHPSLPNYLVLVSGSSQGITDDCTTTCTADAPQVVNQLAEHHIAWRAYMEAAPSRCYTGSGVSLYDRHHDPFVYDPAIVDDPGACDDIVRLSTLAPALSRTTAPPFIWVTPDVDHDMHTGTVLEGDTWLARFLPSVLSSGWYARGGIVIVTFDESAGTTDAGCCTGAAGGHIATIVISARTKAGQRLATPVDDAGVLRTVEALYDLPFLGEAANPKSGTLLPLVGKRPTGG